jgi:hypothetical protein
MYTSQNIWSAVQTRVPLRERGLWPLSIECRCGCSSDSRQARKVDFVLCSSSYAIIANSKRRYKPECCYESFRMEDDSNGLVCVLSSTPHALSLKFLSFLLQVAVVPDWDEIRVINHRLLVSKLPVRAPESSVLLDRPHSRQRRQLR